MSILKCISNKKDQDFERKYICLKVYHKQTKYTHITSQYKKDTIKYLYEFDFHIFKQRTAEHTTKIVKENKQFSPFNN